MAINSMQHLYLCNNRGFKVKNQKFYNFQDWKQKTGWEQLIYINACTEKKLYIFCPLLSKKLQQIIGSADAILF